MKYNIVVIGGSAAGLISAKTAKLAYPDKKVLIIRKEEISLVPCGIPYIFSTLKTPEENIMGIEPLKKLGVEFLIEEAISIDAEMKIIKTTNNNVEYDKLIIATGSEPFVPKIDGVELNGVYIVPKDYEYLKKLVNRVKDAKNVVVIGGGFIGVEISDEIKKEGKNVTIIEAMDWLLPLAFDEDFSEKITDIISKSGLNIITSNKVAKILGNNGNVIGVELENGEKIDADTVILSIGYKANTKLAKDAGLFIGKTGAIWTDEYLRTSHKDIFAAGDCVEHKDFFTRKATKLMLASMATFDARIAGANIYNLKIVRKNKGNISIFSSAISGLAMGAAGITERTAQIEGFEIVTGTFTAIDRHPGTIPDKSSQCVKLIFSKHSGILLGSQIVTGKSAGELINILGIAIQKGMTATELATLQFGTHPLLTAAPTMYPIVLAAESVLRQVCNR